MSRAALLGAVVACAGCGEDECPAHRPIDSGVLCAGANVLAARYSAFVNPTQDEIERAYQTYYSALRRLTQIEYVGPTSWSGLTLVSVVASAVDSEVASRWGAGEISTGIAEIDDALQQATLSSVQPSGPDFLLTFRRAINASTLDAVLAPYPEIDVNGETFIRPQGSEVWFEFDELGETTEVTLRFGWGDCFVECLGQHWWRIISHSDGSATLVEEWGDEIPAEVAAANRDAWDLW